MKKILLTLFTFLPIFCFASIFSSDPIKVPKITKYALYYQNIDNKIPNNNKADINTTLLIYDIQMQTSTLVGMNYLENNTVKKYKNSQWMMPPSEMITTAIFQSILDKNIVTKLAYKDINIRKNFILSGTSSYGPILDITHKRFTFYITFYLTDQKDLETATKTFYFNKRVNSLLSAEQYASLSNEALTTIIDDMEPWLKTEIIKMKKNQVKIVY